MKRWLTGLFGLLSALSLSATQPHFFSTALQWVPVAQDQFIRANASSLGANWTTTNATGLPYTTCGIASNQVVLSTTSDCSEYYSASTAFTANQCAQAIVTSIADTNGVAVLFLRQSETGSLNEYRLEVVGPTGSSAQWEIDKFVAGSKTVLVAATTVNTPASSPVTFCAVGSTLTAYLGFVQQLTATDSSVATGVPGISLQANGGAINDAQLSTWTGWNYNNGAFVPPTTTMTFPNMGAYYIGGQSGYGNSNFTTNMSLMKVAIIDTWDGFGNYGGSGTTPASISSTIVSNSSIGTKIVTYYEPYFQNPSSTGASEALYNAINAGGNWYLRAPYSSGTIQTSGSNKVMDTATNNAPTITTGTPAVARNWSTWAVDWTYDFSTAGGSLGLEAHSNTANPNISGAFMDDVYMVTQYTADYLRTGSNQSAGNSTASAAAIAGYATMATEIKAKWGSNALVCGNLSQIFGNGSVPSGIQGVLNCGVMEAAIGDSYSPHAYAYRTFAQATAEIQLAESALATNHVAIFAQDNMTSTCQIPTAFSGTTPSSYTAAWQGGRYSLAVALVTTNAYYWGSTTSNAAGYVASAAGNVWCDEWSVNLSNDTAYTYPNVAAGLGYLGTPVDPIQTSAYQNGMWRRRYTNGEVWLNPYGNGAQTITYGYTVHHINGSQAPSYNNGAAVTTDSMGTEDGRVVLYH